MNITLEQIDELRNRVNVTYEEAKSTLEKNDGDLIKSIIELEKKKGTKDKPNNKGGFTSFVDKLLELKMSVKSKNGDTLLNVPLVLVLLAFLVAFWVVVPLLLIAVMTSCKIKVYRDRNSINMNGLKKDMQTTVEKIRVKSEKMLSDDEDADEYKENKDNENEIIIE